MPAANGPGNRPVTRKAPPPRPNGNRSSASTSVTVAPAVAALAEAIYGPASLQYGDGTAVDAANPAEVHAFQRFAAEKKQPPASRTILQSYYREHIAV